MLRANPLRQGRGACCSDAADLAGLGDGPRHQGRELDLTAGWRARFGQVLLFDPANAPAAYNPLFEVRRGEWEVRDAQNIADVLVDPLGTWTRRNTGRGQPIRCSSARSCTYSTASPTSRWRRRQLPLRSASPDRNDAAGDDVATPHLGERGAHPVIASSARELLNKSDNERSGVLSTAMSFLGLYRDPVVAAVTRRCDWRIWDLVKRHRRRRRSPSWHPRRTSAAPSRSSG